MEPSHKVAADGDLAACSEPDALLVFTCLGLARAITDVPDVALNTEACHVDQRNR